MIDLSANTNRWGMPPAARRAIADLELASSYPEWNAKSLTRAVATHLGVDAGQVFCGCGSDDVLDAVLGTVANPGDTIAIPEPTFVMLPVFARANRLDLVSIPPRSAMEVDVEAIIASGPQVVYLCSPNNPTGAIVPPESIERVLSESDATVILDEAYVDFDGATALALIGRHPRLLIVRTFSKAFGLAALRVGYVVGPRDVVARIAATRGPFQVNAVASRAAIAALRDDLEWVRDKARLAVTNRERFVSELAAIGMEALPSRANFVLVPVRDASAMTVALRERGILVRAFPSLPLIGDAIRITVGPWDEMQQAIAALSVRAPTTITTGAVTCA